MTKSMLLLKKHSLIGTDSLIFIMTNPNQLWIDMERLNALYEELCWDHDDELKFTIEGDKIIISNQSQE